MNEENIFNSEYIEKVLQLNEKRAVTPYCTVLTYGCQQNVNDSEKIKGLCSEMGYIITDKKEDADLLIFNTCAVRDTAERKAMGNIGAAKSFKTKKADMTMVLCGCMSEQEHIKAEIKKKHSHIDIVFGTRSIHDFPRLLFENLTENKRLIVDEKEQKQITEDVPIIHESDYKANVTIMYGCNNFCSYCIVPYVRGRERSRNKENILNEIKALIEKGYKEFTLLGQNVNSYGKDLEESITFSQLLRNINALDGDFRVRFMTSHPKDLTKEVIDTVAECEKLCNHIHLPVQAGSDRILKEMNRGYTSAQYLSLIQYAKSKITDLVLSSDIIVGFPSETEEDFNDTLSLIKEVRFDTLFTFIYSKRKGTPADTMKEQIPYPEKHRRFSLLIKEQNLISKMINDDYVGKTVRVLCEGKAEGDDGLLCGRTDGNKIVNFTGSEINIGKFVFVKITKSRTWSLYGEIK